MLTAVEQFFTDIITWSINIFSKCWEWLLALLRSMIEAMLVPLADKLPDLSQYWDKIEVFSYVTAFANQWIALDLACVLMGAYFAFILVMISIKLVVKLFVPTVG